jgi:hypothetical protein
MVDTPIPSRNTPSVRRADLGHAREAKQICRRERSVQDRVYRRLGKEIRGVLKKKDRPNLTQRISQK